MGPGQASATAGWRALSALVTLIIGILAACAATPRTQPSAITPSETSVLARTDRCGVELALDAPDRGLWSAPIDPMSGELVVDVLLVADTTGQVIEGRPITYAARLQGPAFGLHSPSGQAVLEAERSATDDPGCAGSIRMLLPGDIVSGSYPRATVLLGATLAGAEVLAGGVSGCSALRQEDQTIAVECPFAGIRRGTTVTDGVLRARVAWSGTPLQIASLPGWAADLLAAEATSAAPATAGTAPPPPEATWTVNSDHPSLRADTSGQASFGISPEAGALSYGLSLPVIRPAGLEDLRERAGELYLTVHSYAGPGHYPPDLVAGYVKLRDDGSLWPTYIDYPLAGCTATIGPEDTTGELDCRRGPSFDNTGNTGHLTATWQASSLVRDVGPAVEVTWQLDGHYLSEGTATVYQPGSPPPDAWVYIVPEIRVGGTPAQPETLLIRIVPYHGDATYTGNAVEATLEATATSPNIVWGEQRPALDRWVAAFGSCQATLSDTGRSGEISCPGEPALDPMFPGGSTTLKATWRVSQ